MGLFVFFTVCILVLILCSYKIAQWTHATRQRKKLKNGMVSLLAQNLWWTSSTIIVGVLGGLLSFKALQYLVPDFFNNNWIEIITIILSGGLFACFIFLMFRKKGYQCPYCLTEFSIETKFDVVDNEYICPVCHNRQLDESSV